uniref:Transmembrane protein n=1 Tax=Plectus sambesii TaxID=2011161 RepID=A0A914XKI7_9BILA
MLLRLSEITRWMGVSVFELWLHAVGLLMSLVLLVVKRETNIPVSFWLVFAPLFAASAFNFYFVLVVFVRMVFEERSFKIPSIRAAVACFGLLMIVVFEVLLCWKLNDADIGFPSLRASYGVVFAPIWVLMACLCVRACQLT